MASLEKRNQTYHLVFMHGRKRRGFSLKTGDRREAETLAGGVEKTVMRIEQKLLKVPAAVDIVTFVQDDGQVEEAAPPAAPSRSLSPGSAASNSPPTTEAEWRATACVRYESTWATSRQRLGSGFHCSR